MLREGRFVGIVIEMAKIRSAILGTNEHRVNAPSDSGLSYANFHDFPEGLASQSPLLCPKERQTTVRCLTVRVHL